jgi:hypothetical protein
MIDKPAKKEWQAGTRTAEALHIIATHTITAPKQFARFMWPDSDGWRSSTGHGRSGSIKGGGMSMAGGSYLGKLRRRGLIGQHANDRFYLTSAGYEVLARHLYAQSLGMTIEKLRPKPDRL